MNDLLELGKQYKSTKDWAGFLQIYSNYFKDYKDKEINKISRNLISDGYALQGHGESDAVDKFLSDKKIKLKSFSWANSPTAYIIIE